MKNLTTTYGERAYPETRVKLLWEEFKFIEGKVFSAIVKRLITDYAQPPMAHKFRELIAWARENQAALDKRLMHDIAKNFTQGRIESDECAPEEIQMFIAGILDVKDTKDEALRLKKAEEHQRFISSVFEAKRRKNE